MGLGALGLQELDAGRKSRPHAKGYLWKPASRSKGQARDLPLYEWGPSSWICSITNRCSTRCTEKNCPTRCARVSASPACRPIKPVFLWPGPLSNFPSMGRVAWRSAKSCPTPPRSPMIFVSSDPCTLKPSITILPSPFSDWLTNRWPPLHGFLVELWAGFGERQPAGVLRFDHQGQGGQPLYSRLWGNGFRLPCIKESPFVPGAIRCSTWTIPRASARASVVACSTP